MENNKKLQYIDMLRGAAILGVIAVHSHQYVPNLSLAAEWLFNYGQLGVQLFFVASAITLCLSMSERKDKLLANFYIRRFFRIAPLYYLGVVLYFLWRVAKASYREKTMYLPVEYNLTGVVENVFFLHGFDPENFNFVVPGGWSIATEVYFYITFPLLFRVQVGMCYRSFLKLSIALIAVSLVLQIFIIDFFQPFLKNIGVIQTIHANDGFGFFYCSIFNQLSVFLVGMLTYKKLQFTTISNSMLFLAIFLCCVSCYLLNTVEFKTGYNGFFYPILSAVAFGIIAIRLSAVDKFKGCLSRCLAKIGEVSYSMYLLHFFFLDILSSLFRKFIFKFFSCSDFYLVVVFLVLTIATYFVARMSYTFIEKPGIDFGKKYLR